MKNNKPAFVCFAIGILAFILICIIGVSSYSDLLKWWMILIPLTFLGIGTMLLDVDKPIADKEKPEFKKCDISISKFRGLVPWLKGYKEVSEVVTPQNLSNNNPTEKPKKTECVEQKDDTEEKINKRVEEIKPALISYLYNVFDEEVVDYCMGGYYRNYRIEGMRLLVEERGHYYIAYEAENEDALFLEVMNIIARICATTYESAYYEENKKYWRYMEVARRGHNEWKENENYKYNAMYNCEKVLGEKHIGIMAALFGLQSVKELIEKYISRINRRFEEPHWSFDTGLMEFVEISSSKEKDKYRRVLNNE